MSIIRSPPRVTGSLSTLGEGNPCIVCLVVEVANGAAAGALLLIGDIDGNTGSGKACACPSTTIFEAAGSIDTM